MRTTTVSVGALPLCHLFDFSFKNEQLPDCWKMATVTPIFKQGKTSEPSNYRPISLTSNCCKVMERIINNSLLKYLLCNSLITANLHGFIKNRSTCGNILECLEDWVMNIESRSITDVVFVDFKKAFDSVSHAKLVMKLKAYGISGNLFGWINSFLSGRSQSVKIGSVLSSYLSVLSGVPQGSVLGPTLFILFINDVVDCFKNLSVCTKLFADDLKLYSSYSAMSTSDDLQNALDCLYLWAIKWQLQINFDKCKTLRISKAVKPMEPKKFYNINTEQLELVSEAKDLGLTVDSHLKFDKHVAKIVHTAHQRAALILKCFESRDKIY